ALPILRNGQKDSLVRSPLIARRGDLSKISHSLVLCAMASCFPARFSSNSWWPLDLDPTGIRLKMDSITTAFPAAPHALDGNCSHGDVSDQVLDSLRAEIAGDDVRSRLIDRLAYASDASHYYHVPKAVIVASDVFEVAHAFGVAAEHNLPITLRSGGTSLSGQASGEGLLVDVRRGFRTMTVEEQGRI